MDLEAAADADTFLLATVVPYTSGWEHKFRKVSKRELESFLREYHRFAEELVTVVPDVEGDCDG